MSWLTELNNRAMARLLDPRARRAAAEPGTATGFDSFEGHGYALLTSFRRSGEAIPTPVWFGISGGKLYVRTEADSAKVKRIRANPHVRVAPCNARGRPAGQAVEAQARIVEDPSEQEAAEREIQANYGVGRRVFESAVDRVGVVATYLEIEPVD